MRADVVSIMESVPVVQYEILDHGKVCRGLPLMGNGLLISCSGIAVEDIREIRQIGICQLNFGRYHAFASKADLLI